MSQTVIATPGLVVRWAMVILAVAALESVLHAEPVPATNAPPATRLVEFAGKVEVTAAGTNNWHLARTNQILLPGDQLRTATDSRATLQLSDRSTVRVNQSTIIEIQAPGSTTRHRFGLKRGMIFFLDREKPADVEFETPLATGAIRGTEFLLIADDDRTTRLALFDGAVELKTPTEQLPLASGQQAVVRAGRETEITAVLPAANLIQWSFYYPAVLNPREIPFTDSETNALANSLAAYAAGDLLKALAEAPAGMAGQSTATRLYFAELKLSVGQVEAAEQLLSPVGEAADPLRELIAAVKFQPTPILRNRTTSSERLAYSYFLQSHSLLHEALDAARQAVKLAPEFGFAWARVAELEFGFEHRRETRAALEHARRLSPCNAQAVALEGFVALEENRPRMARDWFDRALALDGALPSAWVGRALARGELRDADGARRDLQVAATLEPNRGLFRSYLGKAWSRSGQDKLAEREFALAEQLDPADPTAWLYSALHRFQTHQINGAIRDLEHSAELNDNRGVFRSRLQLDRDLATRSADLAAIYDAAGMSEISERAASRAVEESYSDFAGHLFLANSLQKLEDPRRFDLRFESARESELLVANLLAPPGGGNLSQFLSQQDRLQYFGARPFGFSSYTEYGSNGSWQQLASAFGHVGGFSYALDANYTFQNGQRANNDLEDRQFSFQAKQQITPNDSAYLQVSYFRRDAGDIAQRYDPSSAAIGLRTKEEQNPNLFFGWNHQWSPGSHTLFLFSRLTDRLSLTNSQPSVLFMAQDGMGIFGVEADPYFTLKQDTGFTLYSAEAQQIWESSQHSLIVGGRYQRGTVDTHSTLTRPFGATTDQTASPYLERFNGYAYYQWRPVNEFRFTAGLSYDDLTYPRNVDLPPVLGGEDHRSLLGPKVGVTWEPWRNGWLRGAWTRSLGGLFFDNSIRLEPSHIAGFASTFRDLIPESVEGVVPGTKFDSWTLAFDQSLPSKTYFGVSAEWLQSDGSREVGTFTNSIPFILIPDSPAMTRQTLNFRERNASAYVSQLFGKYWSVGARYRLSEAKLDAQFPQLAGASGVEFLNQNDRAVLHHGQVFFIFNHPSGVFAEWSSDWYHQNNYGYTPAIPNSDFWQQNVFAGFVFPHRSAELRFGVLNLADQDYRLNPLNVQNELPHRRTFTVSLRMNF